jgi:DNA polymerase (family 10)
MDKYEIAQILRELGIIIELIDVNPKKSIAYYRAARTVESVPNFLEIAQHQDLQSLPGIGKKNSQMVGTLLNKKKLPYYEHLKSQIPNDLLDLAQLPGINLKKLRSLYESLFVTNLDQLEQVLKEGKTLKMKGFGASYSAKLMNQTVFWKLQFHPSLYPKAQN